MGENEQAGLLRVIIVVGIIGVIVTAIFGALGNTEHSVGTTAKEANTTTKVVDAKTIYKTYRPDAMEVVDSNSGQEALQFPQLGPLMAGKTRHVSFDWTPSVSNRRLTIRLQSSQGLAYTVKDFKVDNVTYTFKAGDDLQVYGTEAGHTYHVEMSYTATSGTVTTDPKTYGKSPFIQVWMPLTAGQTAAPGTTFTYDHNGIVNLVTADMSHFSVGDE